MSCKHVHNLQNFLEEILICQQSWREENDLNVAFGTFIDWAFVTEWKFVLCALNKQQGKHSTDISTR